MAQTVTQPAVYANGLKVNHMGKFWYYIILID